MKKDAWLIYLIVAITSTTTVLTLADGTLLGFLRGVAFAAILDGSIIYWEDRAMHLKDANQRKNANIMKWAAVGALLAIAVSYVLTLFVPVDAKQNVNIFGLAFTSTIRESIHWAIYGGISAWVVLTLGVTLYLREIDPDHKAEQERIKAIEEAEKERRQQEATAYKTAMSVVSATVGTEKAIRDFRENLKATGYYTEYEVEEMVKEARQQIQIYKTGGIVTEMGVNTFRSSVRDETANFPTPSTPKK